ncbi:MAG TPA: hypothetical protein VK845_00815 [Gemmatimonadales bacterium]|nr:hypothetical protein [Gemmatimonadales bacterium]
MAIPLGTIIASMLDPEAYAREVGDPFPFEPARSRWAPADARSIAESDLARKAEQRNWTLPRNGRDEPVAVDLRGVFLRGLNRFDDAMGQRHEGEGDPNGAGRVAGSWQPDGLKAHAHPVHAARGRGAGGISSRKSGPAGTAGIDVASATFGAAETRPRNVAVYYYLRINK